MWRITFPVIGHIEGTQLGVLREVTAENLTLKDRRRDHALAATVGVADAVGSHVGGSEAVVSPKRVRHKGVRPSIAPCAIDAG
jgi:hypothetical protein